MTRGADSRLHGSSTAKQPEPRPITNDDRRRTQLIRISDACTEGQKLIGPCMIENRPPTPAEASWLRQCAAQIIAAVGTLENLP